MRKIVLIGLTISLLLGILSAAYTEQTLTITLDPPKSETESNLRLKHETLGATRSTSQSTQYRAQVKSSKESPKSDAPIGSVGIVTASSADIMRVPTSRGYSLFSCPKDTYLAVVSQYSTWYGILMVDGSTGWVLKSKVSLLDYQVVGPSGSGSEIGSRVVQTALKYLGIPYRWGGYSADGIDCSGFVKAVFASHGISLPRVARDQACVGYPVNVSQLQAGDRVYFACKGGAVDHAGIYMGNGLFIHSSVRNRGVAVDSITKPFFMKSLVAARRS